MPANLPKKGDSIIFLDVESLPCTAQDPLWLKLRESIEREEEESDEDWEARVELVRHDMALTSPLGRAWMIGLGIGNGDPIILRGEDNSLESEEALLASLWDEVKTREDPWWVGHNLLGYDIPFLQVRALYHDMPQLARHLTSLKKKPWESRILDTMKLWPRTGADRGATRRWGLKGLGKLDTLCYLLGIEQQDGVMGPNVYRAFVEGDAEGVAKHLEYDIRQVRDVFKRLYPVL